MMEREGEKRHLHVTGVGHAGDLHNDVIEPSINLYMISSWFVTCSSMVCRIDWG